jgi:pimeloyl-[acyl-carrier protein] methyl ester esterase
VKKVVLLHGWGMNPSVFDELGMELAGRYDVHALALPGYATAPPSTDGSLQEIALSVSKRAPDRCFVVGWSLGAHVALAWATLARAQVEALVLLASTPCFVQRDEWKAAIAGPVLRDFENALERDTAGTLMRFLTLQIQSDNAAGSVLRKLRTALRRYESPSRDTLRQGLHLLSQTDFRDTLPLVAQRALVIHGERDTVTPLAAGVFVANTLPQARLLTVAGAAHAPFLSQVAAVSTAIMDFFHER